jgi:hypothetical protein
MLHQHAVVIEGGYPLSFGREHIEKHVQETRQKNACEHPHRQSGEGQIVLSGGGRVGKLKIIQKRKQSGRDEGAMRHLVAAM